MSGAIRNVADMHWLTETATIPEMAMDRMMEAILSDVRTVSDTTVECSACGHEAREVEKVCGPVRRRETACSVCNLSFARVWADDTTESTGPA